MAVFDSELNKIVVRIVYDGPARSGKTSNLKSLCEVFTVPRRSELHSPGETAGRTTYFDWLHVDSGIVRGCALRSQFLTVPGQKVLARRRLSLLSEADAIVFVVEGQRELLHEARQMFRLLQERAKKERKEPIPIVIQLNKSDLVNAVSPDDLRSDFGLNWDFPVLSASAENGTGVKETAVLAMRGAANRVSILSAEAGVLALKGNSGSPAALQLQLDDLDGIEGYCPVAALQLEKEERSESQRRENTREAVHKALRRSDPRQSSTLHTALPPLPTAEVASGCIWPAATGRQLLRSLSFDDAIHRVDLSGNLGTQDGSGRSDTYIFQVGGYCVKTSERRRRESFDKGKSMMIEAARNKVMLGSLTPAGTVISLHQSQTKQFWLWTTTPWLPTLRSLMKSAVEESSKNKLTSALDHYATSIVLSAKLAARDGIILDVHPSNFALEEGRLRYIDDDVTLGSQIPTLGYSLLKRVEEYGDFVEPTRSYVEQIIKSLTSELNAGERQRLDIRGLIRDTIVQGDSAKQAQRLLLDSLPI